MTAEQEERGYERKVDDRGKERKGERISRDTKRISRYEEKTERLRMGKGENRRK